MISGFIVDWTANQSFIQPSFTASPGGLMAWFLLLRDCSSSSSVISAVLMASGRSFFFAKVGEMGIPDQLFCHHPHELLGLIQREKFECFGSSDPLEAGSCPGCPCPSQ